MVRQKESRNEITPNELLTALRPDLLQVKSHEDDGELEEAVRLGQGPGSLQHCRHTGAVIIEPVSEAGGVPVSPHHDDLVLRGVELGSGVEAYQVETLGYGLAWLPELDNQN